ncbi:MAG: hypothetical protein JXE07_05755 [Candidatus Aminicenantes bacterium]|nr:hypothetical protein [Candidatus Aminicenantes bacterium]
MSPKKIEIDYDHIDVTGIMDQIKRKAAAEAGGISGPSSPERTPPPAPEPEAGPGRARRLLLRLMSPLRPLIKLLILPVAEEHRQSLLLLDRANRRIDRLEHDRDRAFEQLDRLREYTKLLHHLCHNLVVEMSKLKIEEETLKTKTRILEKDFEFLGKREKALEKEIFE